MGARGWGRPSAAWKNPATKHREHSTMQNARSYSPAAAAGWQAPWVLVEETYNMLINPSSETNRTGMLPNRLVYGRRTSLATT